MTQIQYSLTIGLDKVSENTVGFWWHTKKRFRSKKYWRTAIIGRLWKRAKTSIYYKGNRRAFPFFRNRTMKSFLITLFCVEFHEIVHIEMEKMGINNKDKICAKNTHDNNEQCFWCDYTNNALHWFYIERGIEI